MGGYQGLAMALARSPQEIIQIITDSGLRALGGPVFPQAKMVPSKKEASFPRYVIANTDEMEPGTFKDRFWVQHNPHTLLEGLIIAGYTASAEKGYVFIRPAYEACAQVLEKAAEEARQAGLLGRNIWAALQP